MPPQPAPKISELLSKAVADAQRLAQAQISLAKTEMATAGEHVGKGSILGLVAVGLIAQASFFLLFTLVYVLVQLGLPAWASFLIVSVLLLAGAAVALLLAKKNFEQITGPRVAMEEFDKTREALLGPAGTAPTDAVPPSPGTLPAQ